MQVGLLGPLVVVDDDGVGLFVQARKEHALLELLGLRAGSMVQPSEILDALWGEKPPRTVHKSIQTYISALRRVLPPGMIETVDGGYRLKVGRDAVDVFRFEALVRASLRAAEEDEPRKAAARLTEALGLWRGEPIVELTDQPVGASEATRLVELRRGSEERLLDLRLRLGEHAMLVADLEAAVAAEPFREQRWAYLMTALYRCGRQTEALRAYERLRAQLANELGLDPSPELRALEQAILEQRPDLDWHRRIGDPDALISDTPADLGVRPAGRRIAGVGTGGRRHNLPTPVSDFIGRSEEAVRVTKLLGESRLLTLVGVGGAGKTCLALHVAAGLRDDTPDGVWFADLASIADPALAGQIITDTLGFYPQSERITVDDLAEFIDDQHLLLVVDNCEHVIDEAARVIDELLKGAPNTRILATSREPLRISGEVIWQVEPMSVPRSLDSKDTDDIWNYDSVRLFVRRCLAVDRSLDLTDDALTVGKIVAQLEGLPLAIELAAARVDTLRPVDILTRLEHRFGLLSDGPRMASARQKSLEASIDWSYRLLSPAEAMVLRRASIFLGTFNMEALDAVTADASSMLPDGLEYVVRRLVSKSLAISLKQPGPAPRYRLLDSIRHFAAEHLRSAADDEAFRTRATHAGYYLLLADQAGSQLNGPDQAQWLNILSQDFPDLRVALDYLIEAPGRVHDAFDLFGALGRYWFLRAQPAEAVSLAESLLALDYDTPTLPRARALLAGIWASVYQQPQLARKWGSEALDIGRHLHDPALICEAGAMLAAASFFAGEPDSAIGGDALELARRLGDPVLVGLASMGRGLALFATDIEAARDALRDALVATDESGDRLVRYVALSDLGEASRSQGDLAAAERFYRSALSIREELGYDDSLNLAILGLLLLKRRMFRGARTYLVDALESGRRHSLHQALFPLFGLAAYAVERNEYVRGALLYGFADSMAEGAGLVFLDLEGDRDHDQAEMRQKLGSSYDRAYQDGRALGWAEVIGLVEELP